MDKELKDKLEANGFDVDVTLQRFMNNEKLYFKFLKRRIVQFRCGQCFKGVRANGGKITCQ